MFTLRIWEFLEWEQNLLFFFVFFACFNLFAEIASWLQRIVEKYLVGRPPLFYQCFLIISSKNAEAGEPFLNSTNFFVVFLVSACCKEYRSTWIPVSCPGHKTILVYILGSDQSQLIPYSRKASIKHLKLECQFL